MKKILLALAIAWTGLTGSAQINKADMNLNVRPGDDFWTYAVGGWLKNNPLDKQHSWNGAFVTLDDQNTERLHELILDYAKVQLPQGTDGQKVGALYRIYMDSVRRNSDGYKPLQPYLDKIRALDNRKDLLKLMYEYDYLGFSTAPFGMKLDIDSRNPTEFIIDVGHASTTFPQEYYAHPNEQQKDNIESIRRYYGKLLQLCGHTEAEARQMVDRIWDIEYKIGIKKLDQAAEMDPYAEIHVVSWDGLKTQFPGIDWEAYRQANGYPEDIDSVNVVQIEPLHAVEDILANTPVEDLKAFMEIKAIKTSAAYLSDDFRKCIFECNKEIYGTEEQSPRWQKATDFVSATLGETLGKVYIQKYFSEESKQKALQLVDDLLQAFEDRIRENTWMGDETKQKALDKLHAMIVNIGYPDRWEDLEKSIQIREEESLLANCIRIRTDLAQAFILKHWRKPADKHYMECTPQEVNAFYSMEYNSINFPAAILQPPFFDPNADYASNYGAIGTVIGHEMTHGFDSEGCEFNEDGRLANWWTKKDKKEYERRTKRIADWYSKKEALPGLHVDGEKTLGENTSDIGGIQIAYRAFENRMKREPLQDMDGFTPAQRFFLSFARIWASNSTDEMTAYIVNADEHSPNDLRVKATLPHVDSWYEAFNVEKGDKMYLPKSKRTVVW